MDEQTKALIRALASAALVSGNLLAAGADEGLVQQADSLLDDLNEAVREVHEDQTGAVATIDTYLSGELEIAPVDMADDLAVAAEFLLNSVGDQK